MQDPSIDFGALFSQFDTVLMGRNTFVAALQHRPDGTMPGMDVVVCSHTLRAADYPKVTIVGDDVPGAVNAIKAKPGKDIWLFGGGGLFRSLLDAGLVDGIEVALIPVLLGGGIPLVPPGQRSPVLTLSSSMSLPSGIVMLSYAVASHA